ncbi:MAG: 2-succinyl-5-enolpyruvyl-6-hydroxy-3-cyclohexene-1-carboxylic-acid synthase [Actinomycetota bacterium]
MAETPAATFCATLVDEWARAGLHDAFVAPGSRSTPLALALAADERMTVHVFLDERSAGFAALGFALVTGRAGITLCTSGTAAVHFAAAVVEADLSSVPLIVCTADRPPQLWHVGAPQTIDQRKLFGSQVRLAVEPGVPSAEGASWWRSLASQLVAKAHGWDGGRPGPVHANLSFGDPLVGDPAPLPPGRADDAPWHQADPTRPTLIGAAPGPLPPALDPKQWTDDAGQACSGLIVAGAGVADPERVLALGRRLGWPVLADHRSGCRVPLGAVGHFDALLREPAFADAVRPEVVLRWGEPPASKVLSQWLSACADGGATVTAIVDRARWSDPERIASAMVSDHGHVAAALLTAIPTEVLPSDAAARWAKADTAASDAIAAVTTRYHQLMNGPSEIEVVRTTVGSLEAGEALVVASSMPVRDLEWYGPPAPGVTVLANRGANGIDGVVATATGVAIAGTPTTVLLGDVALVHDSSSLAGLAGRHVSLDIVVVDNDGGGIFSFLPQASEVEPSTFETLFGTPHGTDISALATAHGITVVPWPLEPRSPSTPGVRLVCVSTDRGANSAVHDEVHGAVADAVRSLAPHG